MTEHDARCTRCNRDVVDSYEAMPGQKPELLTVYQLRDPIGHAMSILDDIAAELRGHDTRAVVCWGLFALAVSALEVLTSHLLKTYMWSQPIDVSRLDGLQVGLDKRIPHDALARQVNRAVANACRGTPADALRSVEGKLDLQLNLSDDALDRLVEMNATRNSLLHHGLEYNDDYALAAGRLARKGELNEKENGLTLSLGRGYVEDSVRLVREAINRLREAVEDRYCNCTRLLALRRLWYYMFSSPILVFDDHWIADEAADRVVGGKDHPAADGMASSEKMFFGLWKSHFHGHTDRLSELNLRHLDFDMRERMMFFLSVLARQPSYVLFGS